MPRSLASLTLFLIVVMTPSIAHPQESPPGDDPVTAHAEPRWFKGNLHTHSLWSDGNDYPEMIVDWYARHGYQFLALSDHNVLSQGQKWISVTEANKRAKQDGFARYRKRFGDAWVETRTEERRPPGPAQAAGRVPHPVRAARPLPADPGRGDHRPLREEADPHERHATCWS